MTFNIYTLGCKVNTYESNAISDLLKNNNFIEVDIKDKSDITIINTCTVTNTADNKSLKTIKHMIKEFNNIIIVMGCYAQINYEKLTKLDRVSIILGNKNKSKIIEALNRYLKTKQKVVIVDNIDEKPFEKMMLNNFNKTRAFVKIQDGCNNYCAYCIIPYARGGICSRNKNDIITEINTLVEKGHKEIVLTGIHTGHYGSELTNYNFASLIGDILKVDGIERLRISSIEMNEITDEILELFRNNRVLVDHMHIPLQSGSDEILKLMNRKYDKKEFISKIESIRKIRPDIAISTDLIVGFPNETNELFKETIETLNQLKFSKIHVFPYSRRKGTKADLMENQMDDVTKKERVKKVIELSKNYEIEYMKKFLNKEVIFLPETYKDGYLIGHTGNYLLVKAKGNNCLLNRDIKVLITQISYPYVIGEIL